MNEGHSLLTDDKLLAAVIADDRHCPLDSSRHVMVKHMPSDFPGYEMHLLVCNDCGISIVWEAELTHTGKHLTPRLVQVNRLMV